MKVIRNLNFVKEEGKGIRPAEARTIGWSAGRIDGIENYIMPPIPPMPPPGGIGGMADFSSGFSATMASVVSKRPAMDAAFCKAVRTTLVGSTIPAFIRSSYCSVAALKPKLP